MPIVTQTPNEGGANPANDAIRSSTEQGGASPMTSPLPLIYSSIIVVVMMELFMTTPPPPHPARRGQHLLANKRRKRRLPPQRRKGTLRQLPHVASFAVRWLGLHPSRISSRRLLTMMLPCRPQFIVAIGLPIPWRHT